MQHESTASEVPNPHRIEPEIHDGGLGDEITLKGVCDAEEGASCRLWCDRPECEEVSSDDHSEHALFDQGKCLVIDILNADPSCIPELYDGPRTQLRPGFINCSWDIDGVNWHYDPASPVLSAEDLVMLAESRDTDTASTSLPADITEREKA